MRPLPRRLQAPEGLAARFAARTLALLHQMIDNERDGRRWIARWDWGVVQAVDLDARRATVDMGGGLLVDVSYGRDAPAVGDWQAVYFPNVGTAWIKTARRGGFIRWLYYRQLDGSTWRFYRKRWPLTDPHEPQLVRAAPAPNWVRLTGSHVPGRVLVECRPFWMRHGASGLASTSEQTTLTTYANWGFGAPTVLGLGRYTGWVYPAPDIGGDDTTGQLWLSTWEAISETVTWGIPGSESHTPVDTTIRLLASRDGGSSWAALETLEAARPILNPAWGGNANPSFYPTIHTLSPVVGYSGPTLLYPIWTHADPPSSSDDNFPPLYTLHAKQYGAGAYSETGIDGPAAALINGARQGGGLLALGEENSVLQLYGRFDTGPPTFAGFGWTAPMALKVGVGDASGLGWSPLTIDLVTLAVSINGQALIGYLPGRDGTRVVSDDFGASWTDAPPPWRGAEDDAFIYDDMQFVDIPADDPLALEAPK